ncbi:hypothetical protein LH19_04325 [Sphingopyxis macrogoltabida]|nr:hypothetical protein LH19_04325 [Sphingopyxis macrogoltabida]
MRPEQRGFDSRCRSGGYRAIPRSGLQLGANFEKIIRKYYARPDFALSNSNAAPAYLSLLRTTRHLPWPASCRSNIMQDLIWIGIILGLLAASLGYARLCDDA